MLKLDILTVYKTLLDTCLIYYDITGQIYSHPFFNLVKLGTHLEITFYFDKHYLLFLYIVLACNYNSFIPASVSFMIIGLPFMWTMPSSLLYMG